MQNKEGSIYSAEMMVTLLRGRGVSLNRDYVVTLHCEMVVNLTAFSNRFLSATFRPEIKFII